MGFIFWREAYMMEIFWGVVRVVLVDCQWFFIEWIDMKF